MDAEQCKKIKECIADEKFENKVISNVPMITESSRAYTISFAKIVRGGIDEKKFWIDELENFLKSIIAIECSVLFEFDDKPGLFMRSYIYDIERKGWTVFDDDYNLTNQRESFLKSFSE